MTKIPFIRPLFFKVFPKLIDTMFNEEVGFKTKEFEIRELIGEYGFVLKQLLQMKDEKEMMLGQAQVYRDKRVQTATDEKYGEGFSAFLSDTIAKFYER